MPEPVFVDNRPTVVMDNGDGTVFVRVADGCGDDGGNWIYLPAAALRPHARIKAMARGADEAMPQVDPVDDPDDAAQMKRYAEQADARMAVLDSEECPYIGVFIAVVKMLTGRELTLDELHVQASRPSTMNAMLKVWETPLPGPAPVMTTLTTAGPFGVSAPASTANGLGSHAGTEPADPSPLPS